MTLLQLYMPWRLFSDIKNDNQTYSMKYMEEKDRIDENLKRHQPFDDIDPEEMDVLRKSMVHLVKVKMMMR